MSSASELRKLRAKRGGHQALATNRAGGCPAAGARQFLADDDHLRDLRNNRPHFRGGFAWWLRDARHDATRCSTTRTPLRDHAAHLYGWRDLLADDERTMKLGACGVFRRHAGVGGAAQSLTAARTPPKTALSEARDQAAHEHHVVPGRSTSLRVIGINITKSSFTKRGRRSPSLADSCRAA